ncbi:MAG TPA: MiaB/RimO family radical SAM methylthiotransferase [Syntrophorhabdaceae bacterium]|jgi:threonylcarbamoyladenosine tRNA methylthiotransferase MtaB
MKYYVHTTGCKANQWDTHVIANRLEEAGLSPASPEDADVIVVNACALTEGAERDVRRFIGSMERLNGSAHVILTGCQGQVYPGKTFGADAVLGQDEKFRIAEYLRKTGTFVSPGRDRLMEAGEIHGVPRDKTRFFFKIQDGCDRFCAYCIVPFGRGKPRSRPLPEIMETLARLAGWGVKEVVLTGIEISSYFDPGQNMDLKGLLRQIETSPTPPRIRLSSIDPLYLDVEMIGIMAASRKIAKSLHIPLQSGCDRILGLMGRPYGIEYIRAMVGRLQKGMGEIGIGFDVIVGFPTETDEEFEETLRFISSLDIYYLHVFPFSPRTGTKAASMGGAVSARTKKMRVSALRALDREMRKRFFRRFLGSEAWVIPEGKVYKGDYVRGYTDNYLPLYLPRKKDIENNLTRVKIKEIMGDNLIGEVLEA